MDNKIILFCKGADTVIKERLDPNSVNLFDDTEEHLNVLALKVIWKKNVDKLNFFLNHLQKFAEEALRTLCLAWKEIPEAEYQNWKNRYHEAR
jgi:phospholipid-transporting ATPase